MSDDKDVIQQTKAALEEVQNINTPSYYEMMGWWAERHGVVLLALAEKLTEESRKLHRLVKAEHSRAAKWHVRCTDAEIVAEDRLLLLERLEWVNPPEGYHEDSGRWCPSCGQYEAYGHATNCLLEKVVRRTRSDSLHQPRRES